MQSTNNKKPWAYLIPINFNLPIGKISKTTFTIGRGITCDLILHDSFVSHKHITIHKRSQSRGIQFTLICHSKNKIYLNTHPITDNKNKIIKNNDQIWLVNRKVVSNCRTIGYLFKTEDFTQSSIVLQKYDRELASLSKFMEEVKLIMKCTKCNQMMVSAISLHPCSHKLCENCAIWMIDNLNDKCLAQGCSRRILMLMEDKSFSGIIKAYNRYKLGEEKYAPSFYFAQHPFLMQNWIKYKITKNKHKSNSQRVKLIGTQKELSQNHDEQSTAKIYSGLSEQKQYKSMSVNKPKSLSMPKIEQRRPLEQNNLKSEKLIEQRNLDVQGLQKLYHALAELQRLKAENSMEEQKCRHKDQIEGSRIQSPSVQVKELKVTDKIPCWNCQKTIPFSLKNIENKQCKICLHQFCNKEFPPCKNLEEPLKSLSQRLIIISKEHIMGCVQQNLKTIISNILIANIRKNSQMSYLFQYVLFKNGGFYAYSFCRDNEIKKIDINFSSCICDKCWPDIALQLLLSYLKLHEKKLKAFSRKEIEQTIFYVAQAKKQRK